jgi:hypothetical protein
MAMLRCEASQIYEETEAEVSNSYKSSSYIVSNVRYRQSSVNICNVTIYFSFTSWEFHN